MKAVINRLIAGPLRYAVRFVLQRPWLKKRVRDMVTRMPRLHATVMRVMFQVPAAQSRISGDEKNLSPNGRQAYRVLKHAIRVRRH